mmetsp:Transcript_2978/g.6327  ORF Transcript_2978/g.6327 Transcript_2978/m.6327 type:complete len:267 (+) Transcript_2978:368-1168(+)
MPTSTAGRVRVRLCTAFCSVGSVEDFFGEHVPERHHEPAFHLPNVHCGVQTLAKVHVDVAAKDLHLPRQAVHLHFGHPHALAEVVERAPVVRRRFVEPTRGAQTQPFTRRRFRRVRKRHRRVSRPLTLALAAFALAGRLERFQGRIELRARFEGRPNARLRRAAAARAAPVGHEGGGSVAHDHRGKVNAQSRGHRLRYFRVDALPHLHSAVKHLHRAVRSERVHEAAPLCSQTDPSRLSAGETGVGRPRSEAKVSLMLADMWSRSH